MAKVYFSPEHNSAAIEAVNGIVRIDDITNAINYALEKIYSAPGDLGPFLYEAWDEGVLRGLVLSEPFGATEESRILLEFNRIVQCNNDVPELGDWAVKEVK